MTNDVNRPMTPPEALAKIAARLPLSPSWWRRLRAEAPIWIPLPCVPDPHGVDRWPDGTIWIPHPATFRNHGRRHWRNYARVAQRQMRSLAARVEDLERQLAEDRF